MNIKERASKPVHPPIRRALPDAALLFLLPAILDRAYRGQLVPVN